VSSRELVYLAIAELNRRHIKEVGNSLLCGHDNETLFHFVVLCEVASQEFLSEVAKNESFNVGMRHN
jgi:hypothetical protein